MPTITQIGSTTASSIAPGATGGPLYLTKNGAGAPPYSFAGDTDTGWDSDAANTISGYTGGTLRFTLNTASLTLTVPLVASNAGNVGVPDISFAGDTNTGFYSSSDGTVWTTINGALYGGWASGFLLMNSTIGLGWGTNLTGALPDLAMRRIGAGIIGLDTGTAAAGAALEMYEQTAPAAGAANSCRLYCVDAAGKTQLRAIFASGASQLIAAEP